MAVLELGKLKEHNLSLKKNNHGTEKHVDVTETVLSELPKFASALVSLRKGTAENKKGKKMNPVDISFEKAVNMYFDTDVKTLLSQLGIHTNSMSLSDACQVLGYDNLNLSSFENMMLEHSTMMNDSVSGNTSQISEAYRFLIPELIGTAIRTGYVHSALHTNWIVSSQNISQRSIKMPQILRGDGMPSIVNEGADIPMGSVAFGQKEAKVFKVGTGFTITYELLFESSMDILFIFLGEVGNDMAIGADVLAMSTLIKGEQSDLSESAPVIGVETTSSFAYKDIKRAFTRGKRLGQPYTRIITGEDDGINITGIDKFEGFNGGTNLSSIRSIIGVPEVFDIDTHVPPANQIIFVSPEKAMVKLVYRGLMTERVRNPKNQTEELYISDHIGFAIVKRDARLILDKSIAFASNGFPTYMDIDARIASGFKTF